MRTLRFIVLPLFTFAFANDDFPRHLSPCILSGDACPTRSTCTPTQTCGGLCLTRVTPPPVVPCTVGNDKPCPTNAICTPTTICASPTPCGGQCIATTNPPTPPLPTLPCIIGGDSCPSGSFCTQTQVCSGLCIATPTPTPTSTSTPTPCGGGHHRSCPKKQKCVGKDGKVCHPGQWACKGICVQK